MIPRYSRKEMAALWSEEAKLNHWLEIEVLACEGMAEIGVIPAEDAKTIRAKARYDLAQVQENEKRTNHDVIAFLEDVAKHVGPAGRFIHRGLDFVGPARHHARPAMRGERRFAPGRFEEAARGPSLSARASTR